MRMATSLALTMNNTVDSHVVDTWHLLMSNNTNVFRLELAVICLIFTVLLIKAFYNFIRIWTTSIPESLILIFLGAGCGYILKYVLPFGIEGGMWHLTGHSFFKYLIPASLLDCSFNLHNRVLGDCIGGIIVYAILATVLNMVLIGITLIGFEIGGAFKDMDVYFGVQIIMLYSSWIVAVDPVAVLAIFQEIGVDTSLYFLVLGESLFNDAVTIVLYSIVGEFLGSNSINTADVGVGIIAFFTICFGAIGCGLIVGVIACLATQVHTDFKVTIIFLFAYGAYVMGDVFGWSGIVSMITCGMIEASYAFHNVDDNTLTTVRQISKQIAEICESIIFLLIGISLVFEELYFHTSFTLCSLVACMFVRTIIVFLLTWGLNTFNVNFSKITITEQFILSYGGLRGAVALSLAFMVDKTRVNKNDPHMHNILVTSTLITIMFTVGVMGPTMRPLVKVLRIKLAKRHTISIVHELTERVIDDITAGTEAITGYMGRNTLRAFFIRLDERYIRRFLQSDPSRYNDQIVKVYQEMALVLHNASLNPEKAEQIMQDLPFSIQIRHNDEMILEHRKNLRHMRRANKIQVLPYGSHNPNRYSFTDFKINYGKFLHDKKARVLSMSKSSETERLETQARQVDHKNLRIIKQDAGPQKFIQPVFGHHASSLQDSIKSE